MKTQIKKCTLSVVIITFNEEHNIGRCLESIKSIADEIIVVDSFSTDSTRKIACNYNTNFITNVFSGHVQQKNIALSYAKSDLILSLDADEELDLTLLNQIEKIKHNGEELIAYKVNRKTYYCGRWIKHSGWYPDWKTRLVPNGRAIWVGNNPHDVLQARGLPEKRLEGHVNHYSYASVADHLSRNIKYACIQAEDLYRKGKKATWIKRYASPVFRFMKSYFFQLGFLDGYYGWVICWSKSYGAFHKYALLYELQKGGPPAATPPAKAQA